MLTFGDKALTAVTTDDIEAFRDARQAEGWSAVTVNHDFLGDTHLTTTSRYFNIHRRGLQMAMQKLERHQAEQKAVAQALHTGESRTSRCALLGRHARPQTASFLTVRVCVRRGDSNPHALASASPLEAPLGK